MVKSAKRSFVSLSLGGALAVVCAAAAFVSCGSKDDDKKTTSSTTSLTYADVSSVFNAKCVTCHPNGATVSLDSLAHIKTHKAKAKDEISQGAMPPSGATALTADEKTKLVEWLGGGSDLQ